MIDKEKFTAIADSLRDADRFDAAAAIDELISSAVDSAKSAHECRTEIVSQRGKIASLEQQLSMTNGIRYQEMRLELPEGGHVSLRWPDSMTIESAGMLREVFTLQMNAHAKYMEGRIDLAGAKGKA